MLNEYLYDGSFEGLLTCIFYSYSSKSEVKITKTKDYLPNLISSPIEIVTEIDKFKRVYSSIRDKFSYTTLKTIYYLYLSDINDIETLIYKYIKLCYTYGNDINLAKNNEIISLVDKYYRRISLEAHRFTGFVRFKKIKEDLYYSSIEPDYNILPIISTHFIERFSDQNFIIHDLKRGIALFYNKNNSIITDFSMDKSKNLLNNSNDEFELLWKTFYNSVNIKERENSRLQKMYMPTRYWHNLIEVK